MSGRGVNQTELLKDLRKQVKTLEDDLRERSEAVAEYKAKLEAEYTHAREAKRTAATYGAWRDERITQVAAAWVLACVFVRFCEDNRLIPAPFLAGPGERLKDAEDRDTEFFRINPEKNDRDWLVHAFESLAATNPAVAGLFDRAHNPLWELAPSYEAASELLKFWRRRGPDGEIVYDFTDEPVVGADGVVEHQGWSTRFLGDLYQDLSEHARKTYALLQTPEFVEEFILDLTLEPAVREFGLEPDTVVGDDGEIRKGLRTIDPACGSGHFLLGLFKRLLAKWKTAEPGTDVWKLIRRTLDAVHGCDKNPFAVSIARFRLLIAALQAGGAKRLDQVPTFPINVAAGDSLLHGRGAAGIQGDLLSDGETFAYQTEDVNEYAERCDLLGVSTYHVVVGNPPYITVKDKQENENYRAYKSCSGKYALSVPFAERLFQLAVRTSGPDRAAGYVGQITANSFMKREFGKKLIEQFFVSDRVGVHLTHIIDTSGAYIPGHGTPTAILVGRNHIPRQAEPVRAVLGVRGEPSQPEDAAQGLVWRAIVDQVEMPGSESEWISSVDIHRGDFSTFPWSLSGGGASEVLTYLDRSARRLGALIGRPIGFASFPGQDDVFFLNDGWFRRRPVSDSMSRPLVVGEVVRDWYEHCQTAALVPYDWDQAPVALEEESDWARHMWTMRRVLGATRGFGGQTRAESDEPWWTWYRWVADRYRTPLSITFAFVATHNHFVLDRGGKVFKQSAPVIKLPEGAGEDEYLQLLGVLNSSTVCFFMKQVAHNMGSTVDSKGARQSTFPWESFYQFNSTQMENIPLPSHLPLVLGRILDSFGQGLATYEPSVVCASGATPTRAVLDAAHDRHAATRERMIAMQEELDWEVYGAYGLVQLNGTKNQRLTAPDLDSVPRVRLGERAFEIVLARKAAAGEAETAWFSRHRSKPITEIPAHWPEWYRAIVQNRIDVIERRKDIALIERSEFKRRWSSEPWEKREKEALRTWLCDRAEGRGLWFTLRDGFEQPRPLTISQLADELVKLDPDVSAVAALYAADHLGKRDLPLEVVLAEALDAEHVPYLASLRYKDTGLRKRAQWEEVWELQREEDATGERLNIPVPPKYASADFAKASYWSNRGKLDVPKERFVSYPDAGPDADPTLLLGWAGWDHRDQAQALVNLVKDRTSQLSWDNARITPLLAGLAELMPWVRQWFGADDHEWGGNAAEEFGTFLDTERAKRGLTVEQLASWRPAPKTRGRKAAATARTAKKTDTVAAADAETA